MQSHKNISVDKLREEERSAWNDYMESTRGLRGKSYEEAEPWAWARLAAIRRRLRRERRRLVA